MMSSMDVLRFEGFTIGHVSIPTRSAIRFSIVLDNDVYSLSLARSRESMTRFKERCSAAGSGAESYRVMINKHAG